MSTDKYKRHSRAICYSYWWQVLIKVSPFLSHWSSKPKMYWTKECEISFKLYSSNQALSPSKAHELCNILAHSNLVKTISGEILCFLAGDLSLGTPVDLRGSWEWEGRKLVETRMKMFTFSFIFNAYMSRKTTTSMTSCKFVTCFFSCWTPIQTTCHIYQLFGEMTEKV